jgi:hypothetical protein
MGEILGIGTTHYPGLVGTDEDLPGLFHTILQDPGLPERLRDPANWPPGLREEYGDDRGLSAAKRHRAAVVDHFRRARRAGPLPARPGDHLRR